MIESTIAENAPSNITSWNNLSLECGNLLQSTYYDAEQKIASQQPIYIEITRNDELIAGLKLYHYISSRLPAAISHISSELTQFGEILFKSDSAESFLDVKKKLTKSVLKIISEKKVVRFHCAGFYGEVEKLIDLNDYKATEGRSFSVGVVMLGKTEEEIWKQMSPTHQKNISIAQKNNLEVFKSDDINQFISLIDETYKRQHKSPPSREYISNHFSLLQKQGLSELFFVRQKENILSGALMQKFGNTAYHAFGGNVSNKINAGHYLLWQIMLQYNKEGITRFILGELAEQLDETNIKFTKGISEFKTRFGTVNIPSGARTYMINPLHFRIRKLMKFFLSPFLSKG